MRQPTASVVVTARNASHTLKRSLAALALQTLPGFEREVIVADDASRDRTRKLAAAAGAHVVRMHGRRRSDTLRNRSYEATRGEVIAFTEADYCARPDWLERGLACLLHTGADLVTGPVELDVDEHPSLSELLLASRQPHQASMYAAGYASASNLLVRREVFETIGGFEGALAVDADRDFCARAAEAGFTLRYCPTMAVVRQSRRVSRLATSWFQLGLGRARTRTGSTFQRPVDRERLHLRECLPAFMRGADPRGVERVRRQGYLPSSDELLKVDLVGYVLADLPQLAGYMAGSMLNRSRTAPSS